MTSKNVEQNTLTWNEVKNNISLWNAIRRSSLLLKPLFEGNLHFEFHTSTTINLPKTKLHFYPAISSNDLVLYIIKEDDDQRSVYESDPSGFTNKIITAKLKQPHDNSTPAVHSNIVDIPSKISAGEAIARIGNWITYHNRWIDENAPNTGIFQAFHLDASDEGLHDKLLGYFGLKGTADPFDFSADLVLLNTENDFFNTVRPVPPFGQEGEAAFFLLEAATNTEM